MGRTKIGVFQWKHDPEERLNQLEGARIELYQRGVMIDDNCWNAVRNWVKDNSYGWFVCPEMHPENSFSSKTPGPSREKYIKDIYLGDTVVVVIYGSNPKKSGLSVVQVGEARSLMKIAGIEI